MPTRKIEMMNGTRQPHALNASTRHRVLHDDTYEQREKQSKRRRDLNETRVEAAFLIRHMLGDVNCRATIFATQRESLKHP
jgi:hypothetical protein